MTHPIEPHYRMQLVTSLHEVGADKWDALLQHQEHCNPFLSFSFLNALHESDSANAETGWIPYFITVWQETELVAAMPLYKKLHSYGEYVFDWAWADAYQRNGFEYYPKLLSAIPFTPVSGNRLLAKDVKAKRVLIEILSSLYKNSEFSSMHVLFPSNEEARMLKDQGFLLRKSVQFHWLNQNFKTFEEFLASLEQKKRKNIRAERRKVAEASISFRHIPGTLATSNDWLFFKRCYDKTYLEHHSSPYLTMDFFKRIGATMPHQIHLIFAERDDVPIASSLLIHDQNTVYGRYWGCIEYVPCLHFETAYYQPIEFCIAQKIQIFEGGAQGEHKMARGFLPVEMVSCHHLNEPAFYDAVARFLERESEGIAQYVNELEERSPFKTK